jgi:hypothetical protein
MKVKELQELTSIENPIVVRSGYNGKLLTNNYNPVKHSDTIGEREVIRIEANIKLNKSVTSVASAFPVICCMVHGDVEYEQEHNGGVKNK